MCASAAWDRKNAPDRLTARTLSQSASVSFSTVLSMVMPALLIRMSSEPCSLDHLGDHPPAVVADADVALVDRPVDPLGPDFGQELLGVIRVPAVAGGDGGALVGQAAADRRADAAGAARHQGHPTGQLGTESGGAGGPAVRQSWSSSSGGLADANSRAALFPRPAGGPLCRRPNVDVLSSRFGCQPGVTSAAHPGCGRMGQPGRRRRRIRSTGNCAVTVRQVSRQRQRSAACSRSSSIAMIGWSSRPTSSPTSTSPSSRPRSSSTR